METYTKAKTPQHLFFSYANKEECEMTVMCPAEQQTDFVGNNCVLHFHTTTPGIQQCVHC